MKRLRGNQYHYGFSDYINNVKLKGCECAAIMCEMIDYDAKQDVESPSCSTVSTQTGQQPSLLKTMFSGLQLISGH